MAMLICKGSTSGKLFGLVKEGKTNKAMYPIAPEYHKYWIETPYGYISNVSTDKVTEPFKVLYQM